MYALGRAGRRRSINIWPGFVDGLASLLLVVIFVLMVFMIAQYFLSTALTGRDEALVRLQREISTLAELLSLERSTNVELRENVAQISSELQASLAAREALTSEVSALGEERRSLSAQIAALMAERNRLSDQAAQIEEDRKSLAARLAALVAERQGLDSRATALEADKASLAAQLAELDEEKLLLAAQLAMLGERAAAMEAEVARQADELEAAYRSIDADRGKIEAMIAEIAILESLRDEATAQLLVAERALEEQRELSAEERAELVAAMTRVEDQDEQLRRLRLSLSRAEEDTAAQSRLSEEAQRKVDLLNRQIASLRQQLGKLSEVLGATEVRNADQQVLLADLGRRLNIALASKVQELARYRSEFFGRLRKVLGDHPDIKIVGDRFVFQSEILFESSSAELGPEGRAQMGRLARTLIDISKDIPREIDWVLRVDGHTDSRPISTPLFPSNWELSTARAISVVKHLIGQGLPADRLAATGFGEFQPIDPGENDTAYRINRRIELKLTQR